MTTGRKTWKTLDQMTPAEKMRVRVSELHGNNLLGAYDIANRTGLKPTAFGPGPS